MKLPKAILLSLTISTTVKAQQNAWLYFGNCQFTSCDSLGKDGAECCGFTDNRVLNTYFCMTEEQKGGNWQGSYTDDEYTNWDWTCTAPPEEPEMDTEDVIKEYLTEKFSTKGWFWTEMMIWATYMAGNFWMVGYPYQNVFFTIMWDYLVIESVAAFFEAYFGMEGADDVYLAAVIETWSMGPMRRIFSSIGIFMIGSLVTVTPGLNFLSMLVGWWAVLDFYDYKVDPYQVGQVQNEGKWAGKSLELVLSETSSN